MTPRHLPLHDGWTLGADGPVPLGLPTGGVPATVPGCVHTDLLAAGLIDDPYLDDNETRLDWIGRTDWTYRTAFDWTEDGHDHADLCFDGLDTVATVLLNGTEVGRTANQHRSYRFAVRPLLVEGTNTIDVRFTAPYTYAEELRERLGDRPGAYTEPYPFIRKMACNFGWDWGPTLVTSGIWRPVALQSWTGPRIASVKLLADLADDGAPRLSVTLDVDRGGDPGTLQAVAEAAGERAELTVPAGQDSATTTLLVPHAEPWWPHSHGEQPLYEVTVRLGGHTWHGRTGFRSVSLEREAFRIGVNGEPVFVRGVNWIPDDCFPARLTRRRISDRLDQALAAGVNLIRVWGGGLYESDDFYELADEKGLLVWQDFPFACAAYPEEQPLYDEVAAEARENVVRLAPHPSLVLWCGNNENLEGHADWGWRKELGDRTWGHGYYHELLPAICAETDPTRPYWPGSPYSGSPELHPQDPARGTIHIWDVWNRADYRAYADRVPRFVAEFGFQGPPAHATLRRAVSGPLTPGAPLLTHHQKAEDGNAKLLRGLGDHLPQPGGSFDDWHWLTQLNQARAVAFGIRHFRSHTPYCMGTVVWQLNDCWPVVSWAAVDGDGRRKPLWYALRAVYADRLLVVRDGALHLVNDADRPWAGTLCLTRHALDGTVLAEEELRVSTAPRQVTRLTLPPSVAEPADRTRELLVARLGEVRTVEFYEEDTRLALPPARYDVTITRSDGDASAYRVEVTARTLLRDLALFPDRLDPAAEVDEMLVTLLPGESAVFRVTGAVIEDPGALGTRPVLRCVNDTIA
ncbi:glycoside hydrolase family 2 protein [Streptomyces sp. NBC_00154]|uniref:glycoside hydrolase family 2 protein n=1 Tax=Streptomyces sp. NBC_00154 TaxID=2975670 RepID=UPI00225BF4DA|nr:glycoside hydrolase family 2 protein [Streptomyces sp. NBC_00154]MCX5312684.1 glycoside hydrolase family 2 protein [Streptomyces sp. NBC_00154]